MNIYENGYEINFDDIHLSVFEIKFFKATEKLSKLIEPNFDSFNELKGKDKKLLELAFDAELNEI